MMSNAADLLASALAERDEARAAADVQAAEIARLATKAEDYERQIVALKIDLAEATALMRATVDEAKNVAAEHDKLSDQVRQLAATIEAGVEQSAAAERAALQGVAEYDAAISRAEAAEASAAAMREALKGAKQWMFTCCDPDSENGKAYRRDKQEVMDVLSGDAGRALAERVQLLEAVAVEGRALVEWALDWRTCNIGEKLRAMLESLREKLNALDEKGGKQ